MSDMIITGILSVWLLLTIVCQFQPGFKTFLKWPDLFLFVLSTRLFVRVPANLDLWYRDQPTIGEPGPWQDIGWEGDKSWVSLVWAPLFWRELYLFGILNRVLRMQKRKPREKLVCNVWYRLVVSYVQSFPRPDPGLARQFRIVRGNGHLLHEGHITLFTSEFHSWLPGSLCRKTRCSCAHGLHRSVSSSGLSNI